MTKNEFKQGDKVKLKEYREFTCDNELTYIDTDEIGVVVQVYGDSWLKVNFADMPILLDLHWSDVVLAERQEIKTAFLTRLQSLLREFDARICDNDFYRVYIDLGIHEDDFDRIVYADTNGEVTADNIMDFDKE